MQIENPFISTKTTEIHITSELATLHSPAVSTAFMKMDRKSPDVSDKVYDQYSVTIGSAPLSPRSEAPPPTTPRVYSTIAAQNNRAAMEANRAAFGYTKVALLFFVSLLVTWVSSALIITRLHLRTRLEQCPWLTISTGPLIHQSRLLPHPPVPRLPPLHLRLRYRAPPNGLLELGHLHHHLLGRRALVVQREAERKDSIIIHEKGLLGGLQRQAEPRREEVDGGCGER